MTDASDSLKPQTLGRYQLVRQIGAGGMGDVYEGYEPDLDRRVAIKILPHDLALQEDFIKRFRVSVHYFGEEQGQYFFVMQYVPGQSLAARLTQQPSLTLDEKLDVFEHCLSGLAVAHEAGLIHRDIKPANILLNSDTGQAMLADFGLVKSTSSATRMTITGVVLGTVDYLSPEQAIGQKLDGRTDLYSLGVLMYQLLSGRLPFSSETPAELTYQHAYEAPPPLWQLAPDSPASLVRVVERLMAKNLDQRYPSAEEVLVDVHAYRKGESIASPSEILTQVILAPPEDFLPEVSRVAMVEYGHSPKTFWQRVRTLLFYRLAERAPQLADALQTTTQQVDRAVDQHQRRRNELARLINAAERSAKELQSHAEQYRQAASSATSHKPIPNQPQTARSNEAEYQSAAEELDQQIAKQQDEIEQMRAALKKADLQLAQLRGDRDALIARLQAAERELFPKKLSTRTRIMAWTAVLAAIAFIATSLFFGKSTESHRLPARLRIQLASLEKKIDAKDFTDITSAKKILAIDASHPEANLLVGKHYCFFKDQWDRGLQFLANSSNPQIAQTARLDLEFPTEAVASLQLADAWWGIAESGIQEDGDVIRSHALEWYSRAFLSNGLSGEQRESIEQQLLGIEGIGRWAVFVADVDTDFGHTTVQFPNAPFACVLKRGRERVGVGFTAERRGEIGFGNGKAYSHLPCSLKTFCVVQLPQNDSLEVLIKQGADTTSKTRVRLRRNGELVMDVTGNQTRNRFFFAGKIIPEETSSTEAGKLQEATKEAWADIPSNPYFPKISSENLHGGLLSSDVLTKMDADGPAEVAGLRRPNYRGRWFANF